MKTPNFAQTFLNCLKDSKSLAVLALLHTDMTFEDGDAIEMVGVHEWENAKANHDVFAISELLNFSMFDEFADIDIPDSALMLFSKTDIASLKNKLKSLLALYFGITKSNELLAYEKSIVQAVNEDFTNNHAMIKLLSGLGGCFSTNDILWDKTPYRLRHGGHVELYPTKEELLFELNFTVECRDGLGVKMAVQIVLTTSQIAEAIF